LGWTGPDERNSPVDDDTRLSRIQTLWTVMEQAHRGEGKAQDVLVRRYSNAVYRYLLASVRDSDVADELFQEFALRFVQGKFKHASADKGRFRDYVKTVLFHLIAAYHQGKHRQPFQVDSLVLENARAPEAASQADEEFRRGWRDEVLARTWEGLAEVERQTGSLFYTMLGHRTKNPDLDSATMAKQMSAILGKPVSAAGVRQTIHRARAKFAELLIEEVARSLETEDADAVEQEVIDLGLYNYCEESLKKRRRETST
jgi:RNA polymerase sigma factor (sigma-70 family)